jgi:hypothetical protein
VVVDRIDAAAPRPHRADPDGRPSGALAPFVDGWISFAARNHASLIVMPERQYEAILRPPLCCQR